MLFLAAEYVYIRKIGFFGGLVVLKHLLRIEDNDINARMLIMPDGLICKRYMIQPTTASPSSFNSDSGMDISISGAELCPCLSASSAL